jgi:hypothetical protein
MKKPLLPVVDISITDPAAAAKQLEDIKAACLATGFFYGGHRRNCTSDDMSRAALHSSM